MSMTRVGIALALASVLISGSAYTYQSMYAKGAFTDDLMVGDRNYKSDLIRETLPNVERKAFEFIKNGAVLGMVGLCLVICAPRNNRRPE